jgi:tetratricopeptide (TPR) repeat protein
MDPENTVVRLCLMGIEAEASGDAREAAALFETAWRHASNHVEACFAAHYMARQQASAEQALWWNQIALARADAAGSHHVRSFYASLHLSLAMAHEKLGQLASARHHFERAAASLADIADSGQRFLVEYGVNRGLARTTLSA